MSEAGFLLDPRLACDTAPVVDLLLCRVLRMDDARWPWLILVPRRAGMRELVDLSRAGAAVLLVSADLNEVMELSDSLIVLYGGKIAAYFEDTSQLNDAVMGEYMLGLKRQSDEEIGRVCHER